MWPDFEKKILSSQTDAGTQLRGARSWFSTLLRERTQEIDSDADFLAGTQFMSSVKGNLLPETESTLEGIRRALKISYELRTFSGKEESKEGFLKGLQQDAIAAICAFDRAWAKETNITRSSTPLKADDDFKRLLGSFQFENEERSLGFWVLFDLLSNWNSKTQDWNSLATHHAVTPILSTGRNPVSYLYVELFPYQNGGFVPDLRYLGLTSIESTTSLESFHASAQSVWNESGLKTWFRGRWQIRPVSKDFHPEEFPNDYLSEKLSGRSAEMAFLAAILAASGDPYGDIRKIGTYDPKDHKPEPLADDVAITACIHDEPVELHQRTLKGVTSLPRKLGGAIESRLSLVLLANKQEAVPDEIELVEAVSKSIDYKGKLAVERVKTVEEALDAMLVTNRYLKKYQSKVRDSWLQQWEDGTARFEGDVADGPDRKNKREKSE